MSLREVGSFKVILATSGCFSIANGDIGVALVRHDRGTRRIEAVSFAAFVYEALVRSTVGVREAVRWSHCRPPARWPSRHFTSAPLTI